MRVAVTGAGGRLGRALIAALEESPATGPGGPIPWTRAEFDLDDPGRPGERLDRERVEAIIHAAAWTDVDGCARDPSLALRRNADAYPNEKGENTAISGAWEVRFSQAFIMHPDQTVAGGTTKPDGIAR